MSDFGNTTGTSNPIFRIMSQQGMGNNLQMNNSMTLNPNQNQFGTPNQMNQGMDTSKLQQSNVKQGNNHESNGRTKSNE